MNEWKITLFASDDPETPDDSGAKQGEYEFNILSLYPKEGVVGDIARRADGALDNKALLRTLLELEFVPFYITKEAVENQQTLNDLILLKKMLRQPYLVIKSCTLPVWADGASNFTSEYDLPIIVRWNNEPSESLNKEQGHIEFSIELEYELLKGETPNTPVTTTDTYTF